MNWHNIKLLIWKDWRMSGRNSYIKPLLRIFLGLMIAFPILAIVGFTMHTLNLQMVAILIPYLKSYLLAIAATAAICFVSDGFVGEKERRTIESLLALPCTEQEMFCAKILVPFLLASLLPAMILTPFTISVEIGFVITENVSIFDGGWYLTIGVLSPLVALGYILFGARVSSHFKSLKAASNIITLFALPFIVLMILTVFFPLSWDLGFTLTLISLCAGFDVGLYFLARNALDREKLILNLE